MEAERRLELAIQRAASLEERAVEAERRLEIQGRRLQRAVAVRDEFARILQARDDGMEAVERLFGDDSDTDDDADTHLMEWGERPEEAVHGVAYMPWRSDD